MLGTNTKVNWNVNQVHDRQKHTYIYSKSLKTQHFLIFFQHGHGNQNFVFIIQINFESSIKRHFFALIYCKYALYKSTCLKTSYLTLCKVLLEWFVFFHSALLADWVDNIFPTSKCRYVFSISKYLKIKSLKVAINLRAGGSGRLKGVFRLVYECILHFVCTKNWYNNCDEMLHSIEISISQDCQWRHESWSNDVSLNQFYLGYRSKNTWKFVTHNQ